MYGEVYEDMDRRDCLIYQVDFVVVFFNYEKRGTFVGCISDTSDKPSVIEGIKILKEYIHKDNL